MRAITVRQPWAWAIVYGGKDIENRTRNIAGGYRGPVAIHAGLREDEAAYDDDMIRAALDRCDDSWLLQEQLQPGAFIGIAHLRSVHHDSDHGRNAADRCSWWAMADHWHLSLTDPQPLPEPVHARGKLGLWTPAADEVAAIIDGLPR